MKLIVQAVFILIIWPAMGESQDLQIYSTEQYIFDSEYADESFDIDVTYPKTSSSASASVVYPLIVVFDSQNAFTHQYNLSTIDMLTFHGQIPECVVVGIPFSRENRLRLTSHDTTQQAESGANAMSAFVFDELLPEIIEEFRAAGPRIFIGHSRSAFLTSFLMLDRMHEFDMAASLSGFMEPGFDLQALAKAVETIPRSDRYFQYYFSAGTTREERVYFEDYQQLDDLLDSLGAQRIIKWHHLTNSGANHLTNFNISVPQVLIDYFADYNAVLDTWLQDKTKLLNPSLATDELRADFAALTSSYGRVIVPQLVHIFSIGSYYWNNDELKAALGIFEFGRQFYPGDYDLVYCCAELNRLNGNIQLANRLAEEAIQAIQEDSNLSEELRQDFLTDFNKILRE